MRVLDGMSHNKAIVMCAFNILFVCRAQRLCIQKLTVVNDGGEVVSMSPTEFCTPKFWLMRLWPHPITMFGSANLTSTGYGERSHVAMKEAFQYTNRHSKEAIDVQVCQTV